MIMPKEANIKKLFVHLVSGGEKMNMGVYSYLSLALLAMDCCVPSDCTWQILAMQFLNNFSLSVCLRGCIPDIK